MFYSLTGALIFTDPAIAVVECGGVGFKCAVTAQTLRALPSVGQVTTLYTHLAVREDALELYGFGTKQEMEFFKLLITVSGVGAKVAISLLSAFPPEKIALCVATGDHKTLTKAAGVGTKLAQRLALELRDKVGALSPVDAGADLAAVAAVAEGPAAQALSALQVLGYSQSEAQLALSRVDTSLPVEQMVREALRAIARMVR